MHTSILALALVLANVAEISTMSSLNHVQARRVLCEQSGYHELVTDFNAGTYSNNANLVSDATYYLNAGLRWLDQRWSNSGVHKRFQANLLPGQFRVAVPHVDFVTRIDTWDNVNTRTRLQQKDMAWLRDKYASKEFKNVTAGQPLYFAQGFPSSADIWADPYFQNEPVFYAGNLTNPERVAKPFQSHIEDESEWTWAPGSLLFEPDGQTGTISQYVYDQPAGEITIEIDATSSDSWAVSLFYWDGSSAVNGELVYPTNGRVVVDRGEPWNTIVILVPYQDGDITVESIRVYTDLPATNLPSLRVPWFTVMPPADQTYKLTVFGDFSVPPLVNDTDSNFWLQERPEYVIRAARLQLEIDGHRNISGVKAFQSQLEEELERMLAEDRFAEISALTPEEAVRNG